MCDERRELVMLVKNSYPELVNKSSSTRLTNEYKQKKWKEIFDICTERKHKWTIGKNALYLQKTKWPGIKRDALARRYGCLTEVDEIVLELLQVNYNSFEFDVDQNSNNDLTKNSSFVFSDGYKTPQSLLESLVTKVTPGTSPINTTSSNNLNSDVNENFIEDSLSIPTTSNQPLNEFCSTNCDYSSSTNFSTLMNSENQNQQNLESKASKKSVKNVQNHTYKLSNYSHQNPNGDSMHNNNENVNSNTESAIEINGNEINFDFLMKKAKLKLLKSQIALNESQINANQTKALLNRAKLKLIYKSFAQKSNTIYQNKQFLTLAEDFNNDFESFRAWLTTL